MRTLTRWTTLSGMLAALTITAARAEAQTWIANLTGPNESPSNTSPGTGQAVVILSGNSLSVQVTFSGLTSGTTASHIHCCTSAPLTGTAGVATPVPTFPGFPLGVTSGSYSQVFNLLLTSSYNPAFLAANGGTAESAEAALIGGMSAGDAYLNIHTTNFPSGEIRGFLTTVPEPSELFLLASGLVGLGVVVRTRPPTRRR
jgi:hypothetical protein